MPLKLNDIDVTSLTKSELCSMLHEQLGVNKREATDFVDSFFAIIAERLRLGDDVRIADFASFQLKTKSSRPGRNPKTGEAVQIAPRTVVTFQPGPNLRDKLNPKELNARKLPVQVPSI
jgi:integration host factor subunit alpha